MSLWKPWHWVESCTDLITWLMQELECSITNDYVFLYIYICPFDLICLALMLELRGCIDVWQVLPCQLPDLVLITYFERLWVWITVSRTTPSCIKYSLFHHKKTSAGTSHVHTICAFAFFALVLVPNGQYKLKHAYNVGSLQIVPDYLQPDLQYLHSRVWLDLPSYLSLNFCLPNLTSAWFLHSAYCFLPCTSAPLLSSTLACILDAVPTFLLNKSSTDLVLFATPTLMPL